MKNIKIYARFFEIVCIVLIPLLPLLTIYTWFFGDKLFDCTYGINLANFSLMKRLLFCVLGLVSTAFIIGGLLLCIRVARLFQRGEIFTPMTADLFARLSRGSFWWGVYVTVLNISLTHILMPGCPKRLQFVSIGIGFLFNLFVFAFFSIIATLLAKANKLQDDQDSTV